MRDSPPQPSSHEWKEGKARCSHFGSCGGCSIQDLPYEAQLERKRAALQALLSPFWSSPLTVHRSPSEWYYRNKMEFAFGRLGHREPPEGKPYTFVLDGTVLGLKEKGRWDKTLDLQECFLLSPELPALLRSLRGWLAREKLEGYDAKSNRGFLRHLLVREAKGTGQRMVMAISAAGEFPKASFVKAVLDAYPATTVLHGVSTSPSDVARTDDVRLLHGPGTIEEEITVQRPLRFRISPFSFFQTNTAGTEVLYRLIRDFVTTSPSPYPLPVNGERGEGAFAKAPSPRSRGEVGRRPGEGVILDLYGGAGGIAFSIADLASKIISVENNPSASEDGRHNAALNGVTNVEFVTAAVEAFLQAQDLKKTEDAFVILDPARGGIHPKALKAVLTARPRSVVYVSCNPKLLAADLKQLSAGYRVARLEAVDLFPHTEHVEAVARLELL